MYTTTDDPIRLWQFPNTLAGDTAVTIIVQCLMTWMIEMFIVNRDLRKGNIQPIGFITEPSSTERLSRWIRWFMLLDQSKQQRKRRGSIKRKALYVLAQVVRARRGVQGRRRRRLGVPVAVGARDLQAGPRRRARGHDHSLLRDVLDGQVRVERRDS